ncbi:MAG: threonine dehydratase [Gaiellales bacterium]|jgi:threonine dehydratase|nr:threonine dehydratase [Gaiellales bacterium]MDX6550386.1 threonine dehydratase [Gaiellales bacterium]
MARLEPASADLLPGHRLFLQREDEHELGAFKWRGALPTLERYRRSGAEGVVTASTGNHGAATAWAAARHGMRAVVFVPDGASAAKLDLLGRLGAELVVGGADLDVAKAAGAAYADEHHLPFFEDGAERAQFEAYAAIADEIVTQAPDLPGAVLVPVGNGALLIGVGSRLAEIAPSVRRIGVAAREAPVMSHSFAAGRVVESQRCATFADGLAVRVAIPLAVTELQTAADEMVEVSERELALAVGALAAAGLRVEGSAAASLAGARAIADRLPERVVLLITGRNIDEQLWRRAVERPGSFPG